MDWNWNRIRTEHGEGHHFCAPDARYCILPNKVGHTVAHRITGVGKRWYAEHLGTYLFEDNAKGACYERARREAAADAAAEPRRVDRTSAGGEGA